jgi:bla regulator protein BlaR1
MGSILIGLILVIRTIFRKRLDSNWQYLLWFLLIARLLTPYAPESPVSVFNLFSQLNMQALSGNDAGVYGHAAPDGNPEGRPPVSTIVNHVDDIYRVDRSPAAKEYVVFCIWIAGVIGLTAYMLNLIIRTKTIIKGSTRVTDNRVIGLLEECKRTLNSKNDCVLIETLAIQSPMAAGMIRPYIILPAEISSNLSRTNLRFILLHELAHLQRKDIYVNWLLTFLQIIHWFNPLIWYAFYQMRQDRELACDAYVLSRLKPCEYKRYGAAIITILENYCYPFGEYVTTGFASGRTHMRQRIAMIASYKKRTAAGFVWGMTLFLLMGCLVLTNAKGMTGPVQEAASPELRRGIVYEDLSDYFKEYDGAFVLLDVESGSFLVHNDAGSRKRVSPDSTYKIMSSLIGLETGVLEDENTQMKWDGTVYPYAQWNKDQTLASAMESSASWYFQKLDAYVGKTGIENYLNQIGYGNVDLSGGMNDFWLESSLKISPVEQVKLLEKLYTYELPFSRRTIDIVKKAIKLSEQDKIALYGKTGTGIVNNDQLNGWFIGFVENEGKAHIFATNIQGKARTDGATARNITLSILNDKNILPGAL